MNLSNVLASGVACVSQSEIEQHLNLGMQMLTKGQYSDALSHFHAAVGKFRSERKIINSEAGFSLSDADPNNYMSYYKVRTMRLCSTIIIRIVVVGLYRGTSLCFSVLRCSWL